MENFTLPTFQISGNRLTPQFLKKKKNINIYIYIYF